MIGTNLEQIDSTHLEQIDGTHLVQIVGINLAQMVDTNLAQIGVAKIAVFAPKNPLLACPAHWAGGLALPYPLSSECSLASFFS